MSRRFTDTDKWGDPWYRKLPVAYKKFFDYLCDRCDNAGVWKVDLDLAVFQIGTELNADEALALFCGKVKPLTAGYWYIPGFVPFQFGQLSKDCKPHHAILRLIDGHKSKGYPKGIHTLSLGYGKGKLTLEEKDKIRIRTGKEEDNVFSSEANFNALWDLYPNKDGRKDALRHFRSSVRTESDLQNIHTAIKNYINSKKVKDGYIKNGSTWFNNWKDWIMAEGTNGKPDWQ